MPAGRPRARDAGMVTAELAAALPALVLLLAVAVDVVVLGVDQIRCVDAARSAARSAARGDAPAATQRIAARVAPDGAEVTVGSDGPLVRVRVSVSPPGAFGWLTGGHPLQAQAVAQREQP